MKFYLHNQKVFIVHDKCASTSIIAMLPKDAPLNPIQPLMASAYRRKYPKHEIITFIRNPWDRVESLYRYRMRQNHVYMPFENWITSNMYNSLIPFTRPLDIPINFIGLVERLEFDWGYIMDGNIGRKNQSTSYPVTWTDGLRKIVAKRFEADFRLYNKIK